MGPKPHHLPMHKMSLMDTGPNWKQQKFKLPPPSGHMAFPIMKEQRSAAPFSISGVTPLQRALYQAQQSGEDVAEFSAFQVTAGDQGQRVNTSLNFKVLKEIKTATAQYGPMAPFTLSLLDNLG